MQHPRLKAKPSEWVVFDSWDPMCTHERFGWDPIYGSHHQDQPTKSSA